MKRLVYLRYLTFIALLSLSVFSCTKETSPIGLGLLEPAELLSMGYTDTVQITAYTIPDDSIYTRNITVNSVAYIQLGSMYDPLFGKTTSDFYSQLNLTSTRTRFGAYPTFDSAYLYLPYFNSYGDTLSNMTYRVYNLTESVDSVHSYSYNTLSYDPDPIGEITFLPKPHDSAFYNGVKQAPVLRIPINSRFGNKVLSITDTTTLNTNADFVKTFKGICIIAEPQNTVGKGSIITYAMPGNYFKLEMYYHNVGDTVKIYDFAIGTTTPRFQHYNHNGYAEAIPAIRQQLAGNISLGQQFIFAQGLGGMKIKLQFPNLNKWFDTEKIIVNDAQLVLGNASVSDVFGNPSYLSLRGVGENGTTSPYSIVDENESASYFDGTYNASANSYRFRLTRYIQQVLTGKIRNNGLHLVIPTSNVVGSRLVLNGTSSPQSDLKLYIRYTRLK